MKKSTRHKLFISFIIIFLISVPVTIFYAKGYKIKITWPLRLSQTVQKTGALIVKTEPSGADIYINDKKKKSFSLFSSNDLKTPAKIKNLLPDEYILRLEIDNHWTWEKKINILPGQTTIIDNVYLFLKNLPVKIIDTKIGQNYFSPNKKYILFSKQNGELNSFSFQNEITKTLKADNFENITDINWHSNGEKAIIKTVASSTQKEINWLYNYKEEKIEDLNKIIGNEISYLKFHTSDDNLIYYKLNQTLHKFDLRRNISEKIMEIEDSEDYLIKDDILIYVKNINNKYKLIILKENDLKLLAEINLPCSPNYQLLKANDKLISLYDQEYQNLYLIDPHSNTSPVVDIINNITKMEWYDNERMLFINDYEFWLYNLNENKKTLLNRISEKINNIIWHPGGNYIIYSTEKNIKILEFRNLKVRNVADILNLNSIKQLSLSLNSNTLWIETEIGNNQGIYKLFIQ